jgi:hypothetical protein
VATVRSREPAPGAIAALSNKGGRGGAPMETTAVPVAVVTGAAQGIGRKVAEALAGEAYALALTDLREPVETLEAVRGRGAEVLTAVGDVPRPTSPPWPSR